MGGRQVVSRQSGILLRAGALVVLFVPGFHGDHLLEMVTPSDQSAQDSPSFAGQLSCDPWHDPATDAKHGGIERVGLTSFSTGQTHVATSPRLVILCQVKLGGWKRV